MMEMLPAVRLRCPSRTKDPSVGKQEIRYPSNKRLRIDRALVLPFYKYHENVIAASERDPSATSHERGKDETRGLERVTSLGREFRHAASSPTTTANSRHGGNQAVETTNLL
jgi:hypothetical protein